MYKTDKERLAALIEHLKINALTFAKETDIPSATIYNTLKAVGPGLSKSNLRNIAKRYNEISPGWLLTGEGEMLKPQKYSDDLTGENKVPETEPIFFSSNLKVILAAKKLDAVGLARLMDLRPDTITQYLDQQCGPSLSVLVRLRRLWNISVDALLFEDLSNPEKMENLQKETVPPEQLGMILKTLEDLQETVAELKRRDAEMTKEVEEVRRKVSQEKK